MAGGIAERRMEKVAGVKSEGRTWRNEDPQEQGEPVAAVEPVLHSSPPVPSRGGKTKPEATAGVQAKCILKQQLAEEEKHFYVAVKPPAQGLFWAGWRGAGEVQERQERICPL